MGRAPRACSCGHDRRRIPAAPRGTRETGGKSARRLRGAGAGTRPVRAPKGVPPMQYLAFVGRVARRTGTSEERAVELTRATLETLAERLTGGEVLDLAAQLPKSLQGILKPHPRTEAADRFGAAEFVARVAQRA